PRTAARSALVAPCLISRPCAKRESSLSRSAFLHSSQSEQPRGDGGHPMNRKLIRPDLSEIKDHMTARSAARPRKPTPPEQTNAENYYYLKQMTNKTRMVI